MFSLDDSNKTTNSKIDFFQKKRMPVGMINENIMVERFQIRTQQRKALNVVKNRLLHQFPLRKCSICLSKPIWTHGKFARSGIIWHGYHRHIHSDQQRLRWNRMSEISNYIFIYKKNRNILLPIFNHYGGMFLKCLWKASHKLWQIFWTHFFSLPECPIHRCSICFENRTALGRKWIEIMH